MDLRDGRYISPSTPATQVFFDTATPTTEGVIFDPNTPALADTLYVSSTNSSTWIYQDGAYITYTAPVVNNTEWYINGTTIDAGGNKTASITRSGNITVGSDSTFSGIKIGRGAGGVTTNTLFGLNSLVANTSGSYNTAIGRDALTANTTGFANTAIGSRVLYTNLGGQQNVAIGDTAMYFNTSGTNNVAVGINSLYRNTTGGNNTALGYQAGSFLADGTTNNTAPDSSVFIGSISRAKTINDVNQIVIGYNAIGKGSNTTVIGNTSTTDTYLQGAVTVNNAYKLPSVDGTANYFLKTNGAGVVSWAVAGLSYFTEAQATTGVNATVYVDSLTASASVSNADIAFVPKGTGAFSLAIPDGTATGGNKRGQYSVDLQTFRNQASYVASGNYSALIGGQYNTASGINSFVGAGYANTSSGPYSSCFGSSNTSSGTASLAGGSGSSAANTADFVFGSTCASNTGGYYGNVCMGYQNTVNNGLASTVFGNGSIVQWYHHFAAGNDHRLTAGSGSAATGLSTMDNAFPRSMYGCGGWVRGDSQSSKIILNGRTTDTTPKVLSISNGGATAGYQITLQNNNVFRIKGSITGKKSGSTNVGVWDIDCVIVRGANAASTVIAGSANVNLVVNTGTFGTPTLTANTTLGCLTVTVIGFAATNIQWTCVIDTCEVIYA